MSEPETSTEDTDDEKSLTQSAMSDAEATDDEKTNFKDLFSSYATCGDPDSKNHISLANTMRWLKQANVLNKDYGIKEEDVESVFEEVSKKRPRVSENEFKEIVRLLSLRKALYEPDLVQRLIQAGQAEGGIFSDFMSKVTGSGGSGGKKKKDAPRQPTDFQTLYKSYSTFGDGKSDGKISQSNMLKWLRDAKVFEDGPVTEEKFNSAWSKVAEDKPRVTQEEFKAIVRGTGEESGTTEGEINDQLMMCDKARARNVSEFFSRLTGRGGAASSKSKNNSNAKKVKSRERPDKEKREFDELYRTYAWFADGQAEGRIKLRNCQKWFRDANLFHPELDITENDVTKVYNEVSGGDERIDRDKFMHFISTLGVMKQIPEEIILEELQYAKPAKVSSFTDVRKIFSAIRV